MLYNNFMEPIIVHLFNKSIAGYNIFFREQDYLRMQMLLKFLPNKPANTSFSRFLEKHSNDTVSKLLQLPPNLNNNTKIIAYCLMPTHFHLAVESSSNENLSKFTGLLLNSYSRYFNLVHNRKGPLWQSRSKKILCESDEQLLHLTRYIHLNPVTAYICNKPEDWRWSSYHEYIRSNPELPICSFQNRIGIEEKNYAYFVNSHIEYQRKLAKATSATS